MQMQSANHPKYRLTNRGVVLKMAPGQEVDMLLLGQEEKVD